MLGKDFIEILKKEDLFNSLSTYLLKCLDEKQNDNIDIVPVIWIESRIQNIRKLATESTSSISQEKPAVKAFLMGKKQLIFKNICIETGGIRRANARLSSAINLHRIQENIWFDVCKS